jgi:hypothetical protein
MSELWHAASEPAASTHDVQPAENECQDRKHDLWIHSRPIGAERRCLYAALDLARAIISAPASSAAMSWWKIRRLPGRPENEGRPTSAALPIDSSHSEPAIGKFHLRRH